MDLLVETHPRAHAFVPANVLSLTASTRRPTFRQPEFSRASTHGGAHPLRAREARHSDKTLVARERICE
jgi:hypothetical protein